MKTDTAKRSDFAFEYIQHVENNGGVDALHSHLNPFTEAGAKMCVGVYAHAKKYGRISYTQYFGALGTMVHYEFLELKR